MHTVIETPAYLRHAQQAGMTAAEMKDAVDTTAINPRAGDVMEGTGGCRKLRLAGKGRGKSGGYRVITFFANEGVPVFLLTVFSKGERGNLSRAERNALRDLSKTLVESLGPTLRKQGMEDHE